MIFLKESIRELLLALLITEIPGTDYRENGILKSLPISLFQREEIVSPVEKEGEGDFHGSPVSPRHEDYTDFPVTSNRF